VTELDAANGPKYCGQVAAGTGRNMEYYHSSCQKIVATDCSGPMLEIAEAKVKKGQEARWEFAVAGVDELPQKLEVFPFPCPHTGIG